MSKQRLNIYSCIRQREYVEAFYRMFKSMGHMHINEIHKAAIDSPAPRFYVSYNAASRAYNSMLKGLAVSKNPIKAQMYDIIFHKVSALLDKNKSLSLKEALNIVLESPAPSFFISYNSARMILTAWNKQKRSIFNSKKRIL